MACLVSVIVRPVVVGPSRSTWILPWILWVGACVPTRNVVVWTGPPPLGPVRVIACEVAAESSQTDMLLVVHATSDECRTDSTKDVNWTVYGPNGQIAAGRRKGVLSPHGISDVITDPISRATLAAFGQRVNLRLIVEGVCEKPPGGKARGGVDCVVSANQQARVAGRSAGVP